MRCEYVRARLIAPFDFQDTSPETEQIQRHLESCSACRQVADHLERLADLLNESTVPPVPEGFVARVLAAAPRRLTLKCPEPLSSGTSPSPWIFRITSTRLAAAATLLIGLALGWVMAWQTWRSLDAPAIATEPLTRDPVALYSGGLAGDADGGSLTEAYLMLVSDPDERGE